MGICPWFLSATSGRRWWERVASPALRHEWRALMRECGALAPNAGAHAEDAKIFVSWSRSDTVGASATVTLRSPGGYLTGRDGPCSWDRECGAPPPWWRDGMPAEFVRRVNAATFRIARAHHAWVHGPMLREYYRAS